MMKKDLRVDYHIHSHWSPDSSMEMLTILEECREKKIFNIALTEHVDLFYPKPTDMEFDIKSYQKEVGKLKIYYKDLHILTGIEVGVNQNNCAATEKLLEKYGFDFVIASIHTTESHSFCHKSILKHFSKEEVLKVYFEEMEFVCKNLNGFHVLGHMDYIMRYHSFTIEEFLAYTPQIRRVFHNLVSSNKGIEINTKGWNNRKWLHPIFDLLVIYKEMGGKYITIGCDSHAPSQLGDNFVNALELLKKAGFTEYYLYPEHQWVPVPID